MAAPPSTPPRPPLPPDPRPKHSPEPRWQTPFVKVTKGLAGLRASFAILAEVARHAGCHSLPASTATTIYTR